MGTTFGDCAGRTRRHSADLSGPVDANMVSSSVPANGKPSTRVELGRRGFRHGYVRDDGKTMVAQPHCTSTTEKLWTLDHLRRMPEYRAPTCC